MNPDVEPADPPEPPEISVPPDISVQDALADLAVEVELFDVDADPNGPAPGGRNLFAYVSINGGTREGRVSDLRIFQNGAQLNEVSSAGLPQQFSYQSAAQPISKEPLGLRFERPDVSFILHFSASDVEISAPAEGAELTSHGDLIVTWTGVEQRPSASIGADPRDRCPLTFARSRVDPEQAVYLLGSYGDDDPPERCAAELSMSWNIDEPAPDAPFASLKVTRRVQRVRHFGVQLKR
jgi:hypothetical protein